MQLLWQQLAERYGSDKVEDARLQAEKWVLYLIYHKAERYIRPVKVVVDGEGGFESMILAATVLALTSDTIEIGLREYANYLSREYDWKKWSLKRATIEEAEREETLNLPFGADSSEIESLLVGDSIEDTCGPDYLGGGHPIEGGPPCKGGAETEGVGAPFGVATPQEAKGLGEGVEGLRHATFEQFEKYMTDKQKEVMYTYFKLRSYSETAELLGLSRGTVVQRVRNFVKRIQKYGFVTAEEARAVGGATYGGATPLP